jgi:hypothetical protein
MKKRLLHLLIRPDSIEYSLLLILFELLVKLPILLPLILQLMRQWLQAMVYWRPWLYLELAIPLKG